MRGKQIREKHKEKQKGKQNGKTKHKNKWNINIKGKNRTQGIVKKRTKCGFQYWYLLRY